MPDIKSKLIKYFFDGKDTKERCGLVLKKGRMLETRNIHPEPETGFEIPSEDMVQYEDRLVGTWHTHVSGDSNLSELDMFAFLNWPHLTHYIMAADGVRAYKIENGLVIDED